MQEAIDLQQAFDAQCTSIEAEARSGKPKRFSQDALVALDVSRRYAHQIRSYCAVVPPNDGATAEAVKGFGFITSRLDLLRPIFGENPELAAAYDALKSVLV